MLFLLFNCFIGLLASARTVRRIVSCDSRSMAERIYPKLSMRNIEEEVLREIQSRRSQRHMNTFRRMSSRKSMNGTSVSDLPAEMPSKSGNMFYRDFGVFEVITCAADDGKQVVMIVLEGKVCLNGEPVRVLHDGKVTLSNGKEDPKLQNYFDCAVEARRLQRKQRSCSSLPGKLQLVGRDLGEELHSIVSDINAIVASMTRQNWFNCKLQRCCLFKKGKKASHYSAMTDLVSKLNILNDHTRLVIENQNDMVNQVFENERGLLALVKTVKCFSTEAILSEPGIYTNAVYKDIYEKYRDLVKKEEETTKVIQEMRSKHETLKLDKNILQGKLKETETERKEQLDKIRELEEINRQLNLTHSNSLSENLNLENQSSMLEVEVEELREKSKRERRQTKQAVQKIRRIEKQMEKMERENDQLRKEHRQTNANLKKLSSRKRLQDRSILKLKEEKCKAEDDLKQLMKIVRGVLQDRNKMTSQMNKVTQSNCELQKKLKTEANTE